MILIWGAATQRLDSAVMHVSIIQAGTLLARLCRPEVENCIRGLQQYSYAYEECTDQAAEITQIYKMACAGETSLNHMASTIARPGPSPLHDSVAMDDDGGIGMTFNHNVLAGGFRG